MSAPPLKSARGDSDSYYSSLAEFKFLEVLRHDLDTRLLIVLAERCRDDSKAVILLDKKPFDSSSISGIFNDKSVLSIATQNDIYTNSHLQLPPDLNELKVTIICPATSKHMEKYREQEVFFVTETAEQYRQITLPHIEKDAFDPEWISNVLEHKAEVDRIIFDDVDPQIGFILAPDLKWDGKTIDNLYVTAIIRRKDIRSLRDLRATDLPLLESILHNGSKAINKQYGIPVDQLRVFIHYQPSYYHLHVHFISIKNRIGGTMVGHAHLIQDIIETLKFMPDFYSKCSLTFSLKISDTLLAKLKNVKS